MADKTNKYHVSVLDEYREVKADLRANEVILIRLLTVWWILNAAFLGTLLAYQTIKDLQFYFGFLAVLMNIAVYFHAQDLAKIYQEKKKWIKEHIADQLPQPSVKLWFLNTEGIYKSLGIILTALWLWFWVPSLADIVSALKFPLR
jgi:hypothetical protein